MSREVSSFPIPHYLKDSLLKAGFRTANDLKDVSPSELAKECKIKPEDALLILKTIKSQSDLMLQSLDPTITSSPTTLLEGKSALELLKKETQLPSIVTCNEAIDKMLGGGVPLGKMTEFCGIPGIGKTQVGIQLAVDVQLPSVFDGVEGHCIYIDTEGSFVVERAVEIAESLVKHVQNNLVSSKEQFDSISTTFNVNSILSHIYYYRIHDYIEQLALINLLPQILTEQYPNVKLIVIDSITFHFRHDFDNMSIRTRLLNTMAQNLMYLAEKHGIAVVLINQMTTKIDSHSDHSTLVPALGESWGHNCTNRIILYWNQGQRNAYLFKSPSKKADIAPYVVSEEGIR